jgi:hypothetical protein
MQEIPNHSFAYIKEYRLIIRSKVNYMQFLMYLESIA